MKNPKPETHVDVKVNPSCELRFKGEVWGAGAEVRLPFEEAIKKAQEGIVSILVKAKEIMKEATHGGA